MSVDHGPEFLRVVAERCQTIPYLLGNVHRPLDTLPGFFRGLADRIILPLLPVIM